MMRFASNHALEAYFPVSFEVLELVMMYQVSPQICWVFSSGNSLYMEGKIQAMLKYPVLATSAQRFIEPIHARK